MRIKILAIVLAMGAALWACKSKNENTSDMGKAILSVRLVDSTGQYDAVNIDILRLRMRFNNQWVELPNSSPGIHNLLEFNNGNFLILLPDTGVVPGNLSEIRLILGDSN